MPIKNHHRNKTPQRYLHRVSLKAQSGAVLLLFVLLIVIGSSYALVTKLNTNLALTQQSKETGIALSAAKNALISYAITFPDHNASGVIDGPGYLLCPDLNNDGSAVANCSIGGGTTIGRLPNQTLRLEELRDASGQRLWYALSQNFRFGNNKTIPLNSESPSSAELSINGVGDIVAVIIAPGAPVDSQTRDINEIDIADEIEHYLEGDNNDLDANYITTLGDFQRKDGEYDANDNYTFNDQVVFITRKELMEAVEKRVLGEVKQALLNYQTNNGEFPWLAPFSDPSTSSYLRMANTYEGHLSFDLNSDGDAGEQSDLPDWFLNNNWHHLIYIAYAPGETLPGDNACTTSGTDCLVLNNSGTPNNDKRALAMIAGEDLTAQRPSGVLAHYFENGNATPLDNNFWKDQTTDVFNDQIKVISISP